MCLVCPSSAYKLTLSSSTLSNREKLAYTNAVKCLMNSPSQMAEGEAPGAKSRYDDFVAIHITQTPFIHLSGSFLSWHRNYIYAFERALRDECDYDGYLPYWNWGKSAKDPINSPYMDGSPYSQGGNGVWRPHNCTRPGNINAPCISPVVEGRGGGCVETGPYVGYQANLSSVDTWFDYPNVVAGPLLSYQPRCIQRDILPEYTAKWQTDDHLLALYTNSSLNTIGPWQAALQSGTGLHSVGHFSYGGNPGGDVYTSPNDPMFWLHHGMIDRSWWVWQNQDPITRSFQIAGTRTMNNSPPSEDATLEDIIDLGAVTPKCMSKLGIKHHVSSVAGPYCYIYL
ncbi:putative tyrosinase [Thozetella sp. PMI_491]|nr:putative tyrosinase [Thozetella sp. PMI_491]